MVFKNLFEKTYLEFMAFLSEFMNTLAKDTNMAAKVVCFGKSCLVEQAI